MSSGSPISTDQERFQTTLQRALDSLGVSLNDGQYGLLYRHYRLVVATNEQYNLTRITSPEDAALKHYADSLSLLKVPLLNAASRVRVIDVGTGAGFPAVPLAVLCPSWKVTAIDGTGKKVRFVADSSAELGLANLVTRQIRAEDLAKETPGAFDLVLLRAVADMGKGIESTAALVRPGGLIVFYKTAQPDAELENARKAAARNQLEMLDAERVTLVGPEETLNRCFYCFRRK